MSLERSRVISHRGPAAAALSRFAPCVALLLGLATAASAQLFPMQQLVLPTAPNRVAVADLDGDGHLDVVTERSFGVLHKACVFLGTGRVVFEPVAQFPTPAKVEDIGVADVDGGAPDFVGACLLNDTIVVLPGDGAGALGAAYEVPAGIDPKELELADLDADGLADVLVASSSAAQLTRLLSLGAGQFASAMHALPGIPLALDAADLDGDGDLDVVTASASSGSPLATVLRGDGLGGLATTTSFALGGVPVDVALGDVSGDGKADLVAALTGGQAALLLGNGAGGFGAPAVFAAGSNVRAVALADLDEDGLKDLVFADALGDAASVLLNLGGGAFAAPAAYTVGDNPVAVAVAELSEDGHLDVITSESVATTLTLLHGDGSGTFAETHAYGTGPFPNAVVLGDLDGDLKLDAVTANRFGNSVSVLLGDGAGGFGAHTDYAAGTELRDVRLADLDGNGDLDAVVADAAGQAVAVLLGDGRGTLAMTRAITLPGDVRRVGVADLDGDGDVDVIAGTTGGAGGSARVLLNDGAGNLALLAGSPITFNFVHDLALADLDGNLLPDLLVSEGPTDVSLNAGAGAFVEFSHLSVFGSARAIATADVNADGFRDEVSGGLDFTSGGSAESAGVAIRLGDGKGGLGPPLKRELSATISPSRIVVADVDGDGLRDAVLCQDISVISGASYFSVILGDGAGGITGIAQFGTGPLAHAVAVGDLDGDHLPDVVTANDSSPDGSITVHRNLSPHFLWTDLGHALAGSAGTPRLEGSGALSAGAEVKLALDDVPANTLCFLVLGLADLSAPFKGGVLVPAPLLVAAGLPTGPDGFLALQSHWPAGLPPGFALYFQDWLPDAAAPQGWSASNGLRALTP